MNRNHLYNKIHREKNKRYSVRDKRTNEILDKLYRNKKITNEERQYLYNKMNNNNNKYNYPYK